MGHRGLAKAIKICDCFMNTPRPGKRKAGGLAESEILESLPPGMPEVGRGTMVTPVPSNTSRERPAPLRRYRRDY